MAVRCLSMLIFVCIALVEILLRNASSYRASQGIPINPKPFLNELTGKAVRDYCVYYYRAFKRQSFALWEEMKCLIFVTGASQAQVGHGVQGIVGLCR